MYQFWLFIAGIVALAAVAMAAWGAHGLTGLEPYPRLTEIFDTAQQFHLAHAIALFGVAILFTATEGRRNLWGTVTLNLAAFALLTGTVLFSGGIYYQVLNVQQSGLKVVPAGGMAFMIGWIAVSVSVFGIRGVGKPG